MLKRSYQRTEDKLIFQGKHYNEKAREAQFLKHENETQSCTFRPALS